MPSGTKKRKSGIVIISGNTRIVMDYSIAVKCGCTSFSTGLVGFYEKPIEIPEKYSTVLGYVCDFMKECGIIPKDKILLFADLLLHLDVPEKYYDKIAHEVIPCLKEGSLKHLDGEVLYDLGIKPELWLERVINENKSLQWGRYVIKHKIPHIFSQAMLLFTPQQRAMEIEGKESSSLASVYFPCELTIPTYEMYIRVIIGTEIKMFTLCTSYGNYFSAQLPKAKEKTICEGIFITRGRIEKHSYTVQSNNGIIRALVKTDLSNPLYIMLE